MHVCVSAARAFCPGATRRRRRRSFAAVDCFSRTRFSRAPPAVGFSFSRRVPVGHHSCVPTADATAAAAVVVFIIRSVGRPPSRQQPRRLPQTLHPLRHSRIVLLCYNNKQYNNIILLRHRLQIQDVCLFNHIR